MPAMSTVETFCDQRAERAGALGALERVERRAEADLVLEPAHQQRHGADRGIADEADQQHLRAVRERPLGQRSQRHPGARHEADELERGEDQQRDGENEGRQRDEPQRRADERAGHREVDAKRGAQDALDQPLDDERRRGRQQQRR